MPTSTANLNPVISSASKCLTRTCCWLPFPLHLPAIRIDPSSPHSRSASLWPHRDQRWHGGLR